MKDRDVATPRTPRAAGTRAEPAVPPLLGLQRLAGNAATAQAVALQREAEGEGGAEEAVQRSPIKAEDEDLRE